MPANLENSAVATGLEKVSFIPIPKKGNAKECSNYHTIAFEKAEEPEIKFPTSIGSLKKQESSKKHLFLLY